MVDLDADDELGGKGKKVRLGLVAWPRNFDHVKALELCTCFDRAHESGMLR